MSSRLVSTALLLLAIASAAAAQTTTRFEGRLVREDTGAPVAGATLSIVGVSGSVIAVAQSGQQERRRFADREFDVAIAGGEFLQRCRAGVIDAVPPACFLKDRVCHGDVDEIRPGDELLVRVGYRSHDDHPQTHDGADACTAHH